MARTDDGTEYVLVTEYFHPDGASTGQLMTDLATGLEERGLEMTVYTGQPNYHSGETGRLSAVDEYQGVDVRRIPLPQLRQTSLSRRLVNWAVFTVWATVALALDSADRERELLFVSNPPFLPLGVWLVGRLRGWPYTYIVYDLYPDMAIEPGHLARDGLIARIWRAVHRRVFDRAAHVVALGPAMREAIVEAAGPDFDPETVTIIHNWADPEFITPTRKANNWFSREHDLIDTFTLLYSGNIGDNHDLETVVRGVARLRDESVKLLVIGEGDRKDDVVALAEDLDLRPDTVEFLPYQDREDLPATLTCADISVVSVNEGMKGVCVSAKLYTAMAAGQPMLVISHPEDDEARMVRTWNAGLHVAHGDAEGVAACVRQWRESPTLLERQGRNARAALEQRYTERRAIDRYYDLLTRERQAAVQ